MSIEQYFEERDPNVYASLDDDIIGMEDIKSILKGSILREKENEKFDYVISENFSFIFTGEVGSGKTYINDCFITTSAYIGNYKIVCLPVSEVYLNCDNDKEMILNNMFDEFIDYINGEVQDCYKMFVSLGDITELLENKKVLFVLCNFVSKLRYRKDHHFIITANCDVVSSRLPNILKSVFLPIQVKNPNSKEREKFFEVYNLKYFLYTKENNEEIDSTYFAEMTEGFSYKELMELNNIIILYCRGVYIDDVGEEAYKAKSEEEIFPGIFLNREKFNRFIEAVKENRFEEINSTGNISTVYIPANIGEQEQVYTNKKEEINTSEYNDVSFSKEEESYLNQTIDEKFMFDEKPEFP